MRLLAVAVVIAVLGLAAARAGEVSLRIVNVVTPHSASPRLERARSRCAS